MQQDVKQQRSGMEKNIILNGLKCFITNGPLADYYMVVALTNPELKTKGLTAFISRT